ncbi:hypothetical protein K461DRAFT_228555 [Myriangium duriaei CBS 260.36]|uniref:PAC domain-containing protein n=1 Tax=Myriangium duriaei CBS 260.36 TaxID=1168546 RepID=A0A9P4J2K7_9PEZI|nr:hypothetical protein K461DRAFT_228555 [Myriangium duriaei CBS 260.36]
MPFAPFGAPAEQPTSSRSASKSPVSVFDYPEHASEPHPQDVLLRLDRSPDQEAGSYDLKPPPPKSDLASVEFLATQFFSVDHLNVILRDQRYSRRFATFLQQYKPSLVPALKEYIDIQKAISAVEYANAVAESMSSKRRGSSGVAAQVEEGFEYRSHEVVQGLVDEAMPAYLTHALAQIATETLVKEITGQGTPLMRDMIPSLAEVYCVTDPSLPDNPIVYASDEFFSISQYSKEYVLGRNCRFLQGPKTSNSSVKRLIEALAAGQEVNETILNYRRDGSPFLNLLLIAPLYDNKGAVRYFLGAQIDVSPLIQDGRGFESFERLLIKERVDSRMGHRQSRKPADILAELGAMLNPDELGAMKQLTLPPQASSGASTPTSRGTWHGRKILGMREEDYAADKAFYPARSLGPSGRLPGVYQNYLLVRPYPSLRITFTSPALRIPGLLQTKLMDRIDGPRGVKEGIRDAMAHGTSVTAKVNWVPLPGDRDHGEVRQRWLHCTPLIGSDERVGVWMVVMVEKEEITGRLNNLTLDSSARRPSTSRPNTGVSEHQASERLYQEYLRRQGKGHVPQESVD